MKKKVLPLVLTAAMALCAVPAMADDAVEVMSTTYDYFLLGTL